MIQLILAHLIEDVAALGRRELRAVFENFLLQTQIEVTTMLVCRAPSHTD